MHNQEFRKYIKEGQEIGEIEKITSNIIYVKGLDNVKANSIVLFESLALGIVKYIEEDHLVVFALDTKPNRIGDLVIIKEEQFEMPVGEDVIGRIISPLGAPLDGKGPIHYTAKRDVFSPAPSITQRDNITDQLETGVSVIDTIFPLARGQREAIVGDSKVGKTSFINQLVVNQKGKDMIVVYVLVGKKRTDVSRVINDLEKGGAMAYTTIVLAGAEDSSALLYLAPYAGCSVAEYFWYQGKDVVVIYDDLSSHGKIYRELSLLAGAYPGRDSYPGDIFYAHSSLLERAGKLHSSLKGGSLTALPLVSLFNSDVTQYIPTNIMSITDGQIIFDLETFLKGVRPAINIGVSVSRIGNRVQSQYHKELAFSIRQKLVNYQNAQKYSHFESDMSINTSMDLIMGEKIYEGLRQSPTEVYSIDQQKLLLSMIVGDSNNKIPIESIPYIKKKLREAPTMHASDESLQNYKKMGDEFLKTIKPPEVPSQ